LLKILPPPGRVISGSINIDSVDVNRLSDEALRQYRWKKVAMVFQSAMNCLDPVKTIEAQIVETIRQHTRLEKRKAREQVGSLLEMVDLDPSLRRAYAHELSGGMRQRVIIAMALCLQPAFLIADEPTTALDVVVQNEVLRTLKRLQNKLALTVLLISHDISIMGGMSDRLVVMYAGKIAEVGETRKVVKNPQHPYTEALLNAVPILGKNQKIKGIQGSPPSLYSPPRGCRFHPRCPYAFERCQMEEPPMKLASGTEAACWLRQ
jgi:peptide/nickel transport system ATP-binding protein